MGAPVWVDGSRVCNPPPFRIMPWVGGSAVCDPTPFNVCVGTPLCGRHGVEVDDVVKKWATIKEFHKNTANDSGVYILRPSSCRRPLSRHILAHMLLAITPTNAALWHPFSRLRQVLTGMRNHLSKNHANEELVLLVDAADWEEHMHYDEVVREYLAWKWKATEKKTKARSNKAMQEASQQEPQHNPSESIQSSSAYDNNKNRSNSPQGSSSSSERRTLTTFQYHPGPVFPKAKKLRRDRALATVVVLAEREVGLFNPGRGPQLPPQMFIRGMGGGGLGRFLNLGWVDASNPLTPPPPINDACPPPPLSRDTDDLKHQKEVTDQTHWTSHDTVLLHQRSSCSSVRTGPHHFTTVGCHAEVSHWLQVPNSGQEGNAHPNLPCRTIDHQKGLAGPAPSGPCPVTIAPHMSPGSGRCSAWP